MAAKLTILGRVPSKKNSRRAIYVHGRTIMIPSKEYKDWHDQAMVQVAAQKIGLIKEIGLIKITLYPPDRIKGDLTNKAESIMDLLVDCGILPDDNWFIVPEVILKFGGVDKLHPRAEIEVY